MTETSLENIPDEITEEEINISETAGQAAEELETTVKSQKEKKLSFENIASITDYLEQIAKERSELGNILKAMEVSHLYYPDQKENPTSNLIQIVRELKEFQYDPDIYRHRYPTRLNQIFEFFKSLSYFESMDKKPTLQEEEEEEEEEEEIRPHI